MLLLLMLLFGVHAFKLAGVAVAVAIVVVVVVAVVAAITVVTVVVRFFAPNYQRLQ